MRTARLQHYVETKRIEYLALVSVLSDQLTIIHALSLAYDACFFSVFTDQAVLIGEAKK